MNEDMELRVVGWRITVITRSGQQIPYQYGPRARAIMSRRGDLRISEGLRQRLFHPAAEIAGYAVTAIVEGNSSQ
jgi:hypothetical protein